MDPGERRAGDEDTHAQHGGRDEAAKACSGGRRARFRWLDGSTLMTRAFTSEGGWPLFRPVCVAFCHTGP